MRLAIIDDDIKILNILEAKVSRLYPQMEVCSYQSGAAFFRADQQAEILLLDIRMPELSGMELARRLREHGDTAVIIFITASEEYVFQAFDVKAFHYLVKPFSDEKFRSVIAAAVRECEKRKEAVQQVEEKSITIKVRGEYSRIAIADIIYAEVYNRTISLHTTREIREYYGKLSELEQQLGEGFFRTHRSYLVNLQYVKKYNSSIVCLDQGEVLLAKQNYAEFVQAYLRYVQRKAGE